VGIYLNDDVLDNEGLEGIENNCDEMWVLSGAATDYATANSAKLASVAMSASDYAVADATGSDDGRTLTVDEKTVSITVTGTATHVAHVDTGNSKLYYVDTCTSTALTAGGTKDVDSHTLRIADPVAES